MKIYKNVKKEPGSSFVPDKSCDTHMEKKEGRLWFRTETDIIERRTNTITIEEAANKAV